MTCGTNAGFSRHQTRGEAPCAECKAGKAAYDREFRSRPERKPITAARARARQRAIQRLTDLYRPLYNEVYLGTIGNPTKRQQKARKALIEAHRKEYRELYAQFAEEELQELSTQED